MTTTMMIAQLLFPMFALVTLSALINPKWYRQVAKEIANNHALIYIASFINILWGTAIILNHNIRVSDRSVVITLLGWLAALKGTIYLLFPQSVSAVSKITASKSTIYVAAIIGIIISVILFSLAGLR